MARDSILAQAIAEQATPLVGAERDFDSLVERIGDTRFVLIGEASHGTHEFYRIRARITERLIREHGFCAVAAEADWPDAYRVNRYVRGLGRDRDAAEALSDFERFPQWMWRNADVLDFVGGLRVHNDGIAERALRVGFYGLDVYSLHSSMAAVLAYLDEQDPEAARRARERYACFDAFGEEPQAYGQAVSLGMSPDCEEAVLEQLVDLLRRRGAGSRGDDRDGDDRGRGRDGDSDSDSDSDGDDDDDDARFDAEQNARVVASAEEYYRAMYLGGASTWNLRDTHMADTLDALADHLGRRRRAAGVTAPAKIVVWAHNSHVGDSAAMRYRSERDEITIGHLCRQRHPGQTRLIGFTTYHGTVTAASDWGAPAERKRVRPGLAGSYEALFHETGVPRFLLHLDRLGEATAALHEPRLERAIGVVYRPQTERISHYFDVRLADQLDAVIHLDETRAIEPLERTARWDRGDLPETYPTGL